MTGWTPVKAAGGNVSGWRKGKGGLGHWWSLHRRSSWRCGGGQGDVGTGGAGGVLEDARLRLREGYFGQSVGG